MVFSSIGYEKRGVKKRAFKCNYKQRSSTKIQPILRGEFYKQIWFDTKPNKSFSKGEKSMSEELIKNKLLKKGIKFNRLNIIYILVQQL